MVHRSSPSAITLPSERIAFTSLKRGSVGSTTDVYEYPLLASAVSDTPVPAVPANAASPDFLAFWPRMHCLLRNRG